MKNNKGFTIMELLITFAILAVFLGLSLSLGRGALQRAKFNDAFNQFIADFYTARQMAALENRYVAMVFDPQGRFYTIRIQKGIDENPGSEDSYEDFKKVQPLTLQGEKFFEFIGPEDDFAINALGTVRAYPVNLQKAPISVTLKFFKNDEISGAEDYSKKVWIYPSGGIKIDKKF
jgi:prepilin-type N-terminal cleavage/methylation domain-containing protein